jgi:hypothetical protein
MFVAQAQKEKLSIACCLPSLEEFFFAIVLPVVVCLFAARMVVKASCSLHTMHAVSLKRQTIHSVLLATAGWLANWLPLDRCFRLLAAGQLVSTRKVLSLFVVQDKHTTKKPLYLVCPRRPRTYALLCGDVEKGKALLLLPT